MKVGEAHRNVRSATLLQFFCYINWFSSIISNESGASVRQYIGAPIYPAPISNLDQAWCTNNISRIFFCVRSAITIGAGGFGAPILYIGGLQGRWLGSVRLAYFHTNHLLIELCKQETEICCRKLRLHKKINRHRSPRSGTTFEHLPASRPPSFFIVHYL